MTELHLGKNHAATNRETNDFCGRLTQTPCKLDQTAFSEVAEITAGRALDRCVFSERKESLIHSGAKRRTLPNQSQRSFAFAPDDKH